MPQTDDKTRALIEGWFPDCTDYPPDYECENLLRRKGFLFLNGAIFAPVDDYTLHSIDHMLIKYLVEEWDYAFLGGVSLYYKECERVGAMPSEPEISS